MSTDHPDMGAPEDPVLEARIQHALKPHAHRLTPKGLAEARRLLTLVLTTHPVAAPLMNRLRERSPPGRSDVSLSPGHQEASPEPEQCAQDGDKDKKKRRGAR
jgi:hypothetical protein